MTSAQSAVVIASKPELLRTIVSFIACGTTLHALLDACDRKDLDATWRSFLRLVAEWSLPPTDLWPVLQYDAMRHELGHRVWTDSDTQSLWGSDIDTYFRCNKTIDAMRRVHKNVVDGISVGWMAPATINIARGVWTSCTLYLQAKATALDIARLAAALASASALRAVSVIAPQVRYTIETNPPMHVFGDVLFPPSLEPAVWRALLQSHVVDLRLVGGSFLATSDGVKRLIQWLSTRPVMRLHLSDVHVSAIDAAALATALRNCTTLRELELGYDKDLVPAFLSQPLPRHLRRLRLFKSEPTSPHSRDITMADLDGRGSLVVDAVAFAHLTHFSMDASNLDATDIVLISTAALKLPRLSHLNISKTPRGFSATASLNNTMEMTVHSTKTLTTTALGDSISRPYAAATHLDPAVNGPLDATASLLNYCLHDYA
ncbi:hypothetical protein SDRG_00053 [Saprolegnia diclina VS20]|uniref:Uncharacterized protein n=1 Tax=Saprolegnia diclina (strain VS20) TaxID=1156394 RepID=T0QVQ3_SAPDV|nr:hypothetical protein SDRG_00053 [Saprolegnia diclina VS20]EQC42314.1 hypothetical protein SDRG_00053 [Saprolegnia diclina VS20]|eukprot:XP_008603737.1 hypothetical protein SDRG_00053 [Saprolegnia diclina VS20]